MQWLALGLVLLAGFFLTVRWMANAEPSRLVRQVQVGGSLALLVAAVAAAIEGRFGIALPLAFAALGFMAPRRFSGMRGPRPEGRGRSRQKQGANGPQRRASRSALTRAEAYDILGLKPGASDQDIRDAHRRLIQKNHPDLGGSDYLAAKINEAKDVLLGR